MNKLIGGIAALSFLAFSVYASYVENFNDTDTLIGSDEVSDVQNDEDSSDTATLADNDIDSRIQSQYYLLSNYNSGKNYNELSVLQNNGFVVTQSSLADLESKFNNAVTKIDLFEPINTKAAILGAFNFAMNPNASSNFISGEYSLPQNIQGNMGIYSAMQNLVQNCDKMSSGEVLQLLEHIYTELLNDRNIGANNPFSKFVKGMIKFYQVCIAREVADKIMNKHRSSVENRFITTRKSSSVEGGGKTPVGAATVGGSVSFHKDSGSDDSSFYTISVGGGFSFRLGLFDFAELGAGVDVTNSAVFFSLEQLLDSGKVKTGILSKKDIKETLNSRQKMQTRERELLSIFGKDVEGYLKMINVISVSTYLEWPKLTKAAPADEATTISAELDSTISALEMLNFNVVANNDIKTWRRPSGYMTLITEECEPSDGLTSTDIVNFLGQQYNKSGAFEGALEVVLPIILGDIRAYNFALNVLSENPLDKNASMRKHQIEERWIPKHKFTSEGRLGGLKSMIATAAVLRASAVTDREIELFKQLHSEMSRLAQMLEFSKTKSNRSATFMSETTAHNKAIQGSVSIAIPKFGDALFSINRSWVQDNPLQDENGDCMSIDIVLPITPVGIVGTGVVHRTLNEYRRLMGQSPASGLGNTFDLAQDGFNLAPDLLNMPEVQDLDMAGSLSGKATISISMCRSDASDDTSMENIRPLPGRNEIIKKSKNEWMLWYVKGMAFLDTTLETNYNVNVASLSYSSSIGKEKMIIGVDTFGYLTSRYDAFSLGLKDSKNALSPWYAFKNQHRKELIMLLKNIAYGQSNIIFELQGMYNTIMDNIGNDKSKLAGEYYQIFGNFIQACQNLANIKQNQEQQAFEYASSLLDQVLKLNFDYSFMVNYNDVYSIKR